MIIKNPMILKKNITENNKQNKNEENKNKNHDNCNGAATVYVTVCERARNNMCMCLFET